ALPFLFGQLVVQVFAVALQNVRHDPRLRERGSSGGFHQQRFFVHLVQQRQQPPVVAAFAEKVPQQRRRESRKKDAPGKQDEHKGHFHQPQQPKDQRFGCGKAGEGKGPVRQIIQRSHTQYPRPRRVSRYSGRPISRSFLRSRAMLTLRVFSSTKASLCHNSSMSASRGRMLPRFSISSRKIPSSFLVSAISLPSWLMVAFSRCSVSPLWTSTV